MEQLIILLREGHTVVTSFLGNGSYVHIKQDEFGEVY